MPVEMEDIYSRMKPEEIPWNTPDPPQALIELVENGPVQPCKAIDFGCGAGNYAIYLAKRCFEMTGIDISPTAVRIAKQNAAENCVDCEF